LLADQISSEGVLFGAPVMEDLCLWIVIPR